MSWDRNTPLFDTKVDPIKGLTVNDLNKYLPAISRIEDLKMKPNSIKEGVHLGLGLEGLQRIPSNTIDLILVDPPESPWREVDQRGKPMTINEYFRWNELWLKESARVIKPTGAIYLICGWRYSGMYQSLLSKDFKIQTRITWRNTKTKDHIKPLTWINRSSDIWFATKTNEFMFNQKVVTNDKSQAHLDSLIETGVTNLWGDIIDIKHDTKDKMAKDHPEQLIKRITRYIDETETHNMCICAYCIYI